MNTFLECLIIKLIKRRNPNEHIGKKITFLPDLTGSSDTDENNIRLTTVLDIDNNECCPFKDQDYSEKTKCLEIS